MNLAAEIAAAGHSRRARRRRPLRRRDRPRARTARRGARVRVRVPARRRRRARPRRARAHRPALLRAAGVVRRLHRPRRSEPLARAGARSRRRRRSQAIARAGPSTSSIDTGFSLERDEELTSDQFAPRRNAATFAALAAADRVVAVGLADPVGLSRLLRGHGDLLELVEPERVDVVVNRVRTSALGIDAHAQVRQTLRRFARHRRRDPASARRQGDGCRDPHRAHAARRRARAARCAPRSASTRSTASCPCRSRSRRRGSRSRDPRAAAADPAHERIAACRTPAPEARTTLDLCRPSVISSSPRAAAVRPTSTGCTCSSATCSCSPTSRSPTSCCGCRPGDDELRRRRALASVERGDALLPRLRRASRSSRSGASS